MPIEKLPSYAGQILRIDLTAGEIGVESIPELKLKKYMGGAALGIKFIFDEVPDGTDCFAPQNKLFIGSGPLGGTRIGGSGSIAVVTKGTLTGGIASSQANGFFGAFLRFAGYDAIILQGIAPDWVYINIGDNGVEIRSASSLIGKTTDGVESDLRQELGKTEKEVSILSIGPAGENLVRFAGIFTDQGHIAAHNGVGAVMGSKKVKAIVVEYSRNRVSLKDEATVSSIAKQLKANAMMSKPRPYVEGTVGGVLMGTANGSLAIKNYTTSINTMSPPVLETYSYQNVRSRFDAKPTPCWACSARHCHRMKIKTGKYAERSVEEPEYECMAAFSSLVGIDDVTTTVVLASEVDRLGMDVNETGWVISWLLECYEKHLITSQDTDGLEMTWGNSENIMEMMNRIARRQGFGNLLAEGVMRAAQKIGVKSQALAIHTKKGNTPRTHDHRAMWLEMFDTCVSNMGTLEAHMAAPFQQLGLPDYFNSYDPEAVSTVDAKIKGAMIFEDSMVTCRFNTMTNLELMCRAVNAATGWDINIEEAMKIGKRAVNLARIFNLRQGIGAGLDAPSLRYGSTPLDGLVAGIGIMPHWNKMLLNYYHLMGWNEKTGWPLAETLKLLGLDDVIHFLPSD
ncbi:MAG: aldehyde ferredoxin oxidoreductase C-terminal domain-containing protein [Dehalococcoidales bacterium]|jgi:aldehyde:ferredoxin oxidoreductase